MNPKYQAIMDRLKFSALKLKKFLCCNNLDKAVCYLWYQVLSQLKKSYKSAITKTSEMKRYNVLAGTEIQTSSNLIEFKIKVCSYVNTLKLNRILKYET